jgi:hypothetical protein
LCIVGETCGGDYACRSETDGKARISGDTGGDSEVGSEGRTENAVGACDKWSNDGEVGCGRGGAAGTCGEDGV